MYCTKYCLSINSDVLIYSNVFILLQNIDPETICSSLSDEGLLLIQGKVKGVDEADEREIKIDLNSKQTS